MIRLKKVHIGYSKSILLCEDIKLERGKMYILVGKNGIGKSTLLKTLSKQIQAKSGEILLNNLKIEGISSSELPKLLSFVPVHFPQMDYVRTREFIAAGRAPHTNALGRLSDVDLQEVQDSIDLLSISELKDRFTTELSDGEKQLVAIAKAVAQKTPIILLDEPTAFLDYSNKKKVLSILQKTAQTLNKCIVLSAHDIELCMEFSSHFLVVNSETKQLELKLKPTREAILFSAFDE